MHERDVVGLNPRITSRVDPVRHSEADDLADDENGFRVALRADRLDEAREIAEQRAADATVPRWLVTSMLEDVDLALAAAGRLAESIAAFTRALALGSDVVPDGSL